MQIIDGCSTHSAALLQFNLAEKHINAIFLVPHSSHLTQLLYLALFAIQKLNTYKNKLTLKLSDQADKIRSILIEKKKNLVEVRDLSMLRLLLRYNRNVDQLQPRYINHKYPIPGYRFTSVHK